MNKALLKTISYYAESDIFTYIHNVHIVRLNSNPDGTVDIYYMYPNSIRPDEVFELKLQKKQIETLEIKQEQEQLWPKNQ